MTNTNHTPEPWETGTAQPTMIMASTKTILIADTATVPKNFGPHGGRPEQEANAARIVSCVNALARLNPEGVTAVVEALERHTSLIKEFTEHNHTGDALKSWSMEMNASNRALFKALTLIKNNG